MKDTTFSGRRVLTLVTNYGVEQDELVVPVERLRERGADVDVAAVDDAPVQTLVGDKDPGVTVSPTRTIAAVDADAYDLLLVPGGTVNADQLRLNADAVRIVADFVRSGRPVAAICHGPWVLVEADVVDGRQLTSYASVATDVRNAGGRWRDEPVVVDTSQGSVLITSRTPKDLEEFLAEVGSVLAGSP